jgi:selenocysteine lyase/cysteine desulfurase
MKSYSLTAPPTRSTVLASSFGELLKPGDEILLSVLEHHSNLAPWQKLTCH